MSLAPGSRLGPYEITSQLRVGGMGEVYRARDTKLRRDVAIKVLPESLSRDPEALERFEREAHAVASLSHPNILAIHDFGTEGSLTFAVMELLEGETLRIRLKSGAIPPRKAVEYAVQIAQGLAAAHDKGIVHRDLKPDNIFVLKDGRLKILDFGLVKRVERPRSQDDTNAPTDVPLTDPGTVMGTASYMSPEQVKGAPVDQQSDIFSLGATLYEMLSGERAFRRETAAETMTAILREEPRPLSIVTRGVVEPGLESLVRHCLEKSPEERFRSAHDLVYALSALATSSGAVSGAARAVTGADLRPRRSRLALGAGIAAACALAVVLAAALLLRPRVARQPDFQVLTSSGNDSRPAASPDGKTIVFTSSRDGKRRVWLKQREGGAEAPLTAGGPDGNPRFSPDGANVLFVRGVADESAIFRVPLVGGEVRRIASRASEADWSPDGREIAFLRVELRDGKVSSSVHRIGVDGSNERVVATVADNVLARPRWSPDGATLAAIEVQGTGTGRPRIVLFPLDGKPPRRLEVSETGIVRGFAWNGDSRGLIVVGSGSPTNLGSRTTRVFLKDARDGATRVILSGIDLGGSVDVAAAGSLVLVTGGRRSNLKEVSLAKPGDTGRWLTRGGSVDRQPVYAPDGEWVAFTSNRSGNNDVWEVSTKSGELRRLTDDPADDFDPAFTRDGKHLVFSSNRTGHFEIWMSERDGTGARRITDDGVDAENASDTPDGKWLVYASGNPQKGGVWKIRADGSNPTRLVEGAFILPEISPDGRLVSFTTAGGREAFIRVVRLEDGVPVPFELLASAHVSGSVVEVEVGRELPGTGFNRGRHRWMPGGGAFAFLTNDEKGDLGIATQEIATGHGTEATRRNVTGFTPDAVMESLGVSPDGTRLMVGELQVSTSLLLAEGVDGVVARPAPGGR